MILKSLRIRNEKLKTYIQAVQPHLQGRLLQGTPIVREGRGKQDREENVKGRHI